MEVTNIFKEIILDDSKIQKQFLSYIFDKLTGEDSEYFKKIFEKFIIEYIKDYEMSLSKLYKLLQNVDNDVLLDIMLLKDFPTMKHFLESIPKKYNDKKPFTFIEGLEILSNYGLSKTIGVNDKHKYYMVALKAQKQSLSFNKKDLDGLLGVSGLFKRETKSTDYKPHSVWTVKNR
jgi:hypothetical protein